MPDKKVAAYNPLEGERPELTIPLHDGTDEQVSIVVVHRNRPEYLNICLQSIAVASYNNNYELIVVDNASGKETQSYLDEIEDEVKVIRNKDNLYWGPAANRGIEAASKNSKYIILLHHDVVILNPSWIDLLVNVSNNQRSGMVGVELGQYFIQNQKMDFVQEWCLLLTRDCWKDIGPFPTELPQIGTSFVSTMKAQIKGHKPQVMKNPICHHYRVFSLDINEFEELTEAAMSQIPKMIMDMQAVGV